MRRTETCLGPIGKVAELSSKPGLSKSIGKLCVSSLEGSRKQLPKVVSRPPTSLTL